MKIVIIGEETESKCTLEDKIKDILGIEVFKLKDIIYDKNSHEELSNADQIKRLNKINLENKEWIIEGPITEKLYFLFNIATDIIFLDLNSYSQNFFNRLFASFHKNSTDNPKIKTEVYKTLSKYSNKLIILRSNKEIKKLLKAFQEKTKY